MTDAQRVEHAEQTEQNRQESSAAALFLEESIKWRRIAMYAIGALVVAVLMCASGFIPLYRVAQDTNTLAAAQDKRNSPEGQKANDDFLNSLLLRIDCNQRRSNLSILDSLVVAGVIKETEKDIILKGCDEVPPLPGIIRGTTTTTTTPEGPK